MLRSASIATILWQFTSLHCAQHMARCVPAVESRTIPNKCADFQAELLAKRVKGRSGLVMKYGVMARKAAQC